MVEKFLDWVPAIIAGCFVIIAAIIQWGNRRDADEVKSRKMTPPDWNEVWQRLDAVEKKQAAASRLVTQLLLQWPNDRPPPILDKQDVELLSDTLPVGFWSLPNASTAQ
jgi:hypothetical protein